MGAKDIQEAVQRLQHLERLVDAYGHLLIAAELERALPALVPILATGEVTESEAGGLLKEILQRGPSGLLAELEELERIGRAVKDPQIYAALNRVRDMFLYVARYNAAALLRRLEQGAQAGLAASLQKEVQAFMQGVARVAPISATDLDEVFADEELLGSEQPPAERGNGSDGPGGAMTEPVVRTAERTPQRAEALVSPTQDLGALDDPPAVEEAVDEPLRAPWPQHSEEPAAESQVAQLAGANGSADVLAESIDSVRDRIEVFNDMLQRWAASERLNPETSPLVRRGRLTPDRCRDLYRELLTAGAVSILDHLASLNEANGEADDQARALRGRIVDGAVGSIPRLLGILSAGEQLDTEVDGVRGEQARVLADLVDYLSRAADLYAAGSPLRDRLHYLARELRAVAGD